MKPTGEGGAFWPLCCEFLTTPLKINIIVHALRTRTALSENNSPLLITSLHVGLKIRDGGHPRDELSLLLQRQLTMSWAEKTESVLGWQFQALQLQI